MCEYCQKKILWIFYLVEPMCSQGWRLWCQPWPVGARSMQICPCWDPASNRRECRQTKVRLANREKKEKCMKHDNLFVSDWLSGPGTILFHRDFYMPCLPKQKKTLLHWNAVKTTYSAAMNLRRTGHTAAPPLVHTASRFRLAQSIWKSRSL